MTLFASAKPQEPDTTPEPGRTRHICVTESYFDDLRADDRMQAETPYRVAFPNGARDDDDKIVEALWAWSPDGFGCYWYGSLEQLNDNHG